MSEPVVPQGEVADPGVVAEVTGERGATDGGDARDARVPAVIGVVIGASLTGLFLVAALVGTVFDHFAGGLEGGAWNNVHRLTEWLETWGWILALVFAILTGLAILFSVLVGLRRTPDSRA